MSAHGPGQDVPQGWVRASYSEGSLANLHFTDRETEAWIRVDIFLRSCSHLEVKKYGITPLDEAQRYRSLKMALASQDRELGQGSNPALGLLGCSVLPARSGRTPSLPSSPP